MMDDSSDFAISDSDKHDWLALKCYISIPKGAEFNDYVSVDNTTVSEVPTGCDFVPAVMDDRNMKLKWILVN
jgi:hypothetical protein